MNTFEVVPLILGQSRCSHIPHGLPDFQSSFIQISSRFHFNWMSEVQIAPTNSLSASVRPVIALQGAIVHYAPREGVMHLFDQNW